MKMAACGARRYIARMRCSTGLIAAVCAAIALAGQALAAEAVGTASAAAPLVQIEPGDQVRVEVFNVPELTTTAYVAEDGSLRLPLVGSVPVSGRSPADASTRIETALKQGG